jgi:hypothetical protein
MSERLARRFGSAVMAGGAMERRVEQRGQETHVEHACRERYEPDDAEDPTGAPAEENSGPDQSQTGCDTNEPPSTASHEVNELHLDLRSVKST